MAARIQTWPTAATTPLSGPCHGGFRQDGARGVYRAGQSKVRSTPRLKRQINEESEGLMLRQAAEAVG